MTSHDMVAHNFANKTGRGAKGFNMFYDDDTIYSYGRHFPIARHTVDARGVDVLLFTTERRSVSTAKHLTIVGRACAHLRKFHVADIRPLSKADHLKNAHGMETEFRRLLVQSMSRRNPSYAEFDLGDARRVALARTEYLKAFKIRRAPLEIPSDMDAFRAKIAEQSRVAREQIRRDAENREAAIKARYDELLPRWLAGENVALPGMMNGVYMLRIKQAPVNGGREREDRDNYIETSGNARFPIADAKRAFPLLCRARDKIAEFSSHSVAGGDGIKLGHFSVDHVNAQGVRAGCHFIEWAEIDRIAKELGL